MLLRTAAKAILAQRLSLAQAVVARQYELHPELRERYGESGQAKCVQDTEYHLDYLAAALMFSSPVLFREYIGWVKTVLTLRKVRLEDVEENLACLWSVLQERLPQDRAAVQPFIEDACRIQPQGSSDLPTLLADDDPITVIARQYLQALLRSDRHEASRLVQEAFTSGVPIKDLYLQVFQRCQREVGRLWQLNQLTVAQEHYCTAAAQLVMSQMYSHLFSLPRSGRRLVATTVAGENHEVGLRIVTDLFEADGWDTVYLGANVPSRSLIQTLDQHRPNLLVISVTMAYHLPALEELIALVRSSNGDPSLTIMVGGYPFNLDTELWRRVGADACASDANEAIQTANCLVGTPTPSRSEARENKSRPADVIALDNRQGATQPGGEVSQYDELSRLNSDLLTLQRELVKKNAELKRSIAEQNIIEAALRQSEARLSFTLEATHVGQWDLDLVTDTVQRTLRHDQIFGYDSLLPEWSFDLFLNRHCHPADRALVDQQFKEALASGQPWEFECRIIRADRMVRWVWARGLVYLRDGDKPLRMAGLVMDITDRKKVEEDHQRLAAELTRSNTDLEQFAYVASHDLQEPLRAVAGCVQVLQKRYKGNLDARADELIGHTVEGVSRMQTLINDLLTYSRIATRGQEFTDTNLAGVVGQALANLQSSVKESGAVVTQDELPTIKADRGQLTQLFQNLIGNALKYRGSAAPIIHIGVQRNEERWQFSVRDNGIGIKKEFFDRIFILFQRLHTRTQYTGTGIGLAVCKKIVERHGGRIWVESEPEKGTTIIFTIPDQETKP